MNTKFIMYTMLAILATGITKLHAQTKELSLKDAYQIASKANRQLQLQILEKQKAGEVVKEAKSYLLPTISASANYNFFADRPVIFLRDETTKEKVNEVKVGGRNAWDGTLNAFYPIINPSIRSSVRLAQINEQKQYQGINSFDEQLAYTIGEIYFNILLQQQELKLLEQSIGRNEKALTDSRSLFLQGKALKTDTLSNYISVRNLEASISVINNNIKLSFFELKQLLGVEERDEIKLSDSLSISVNYELLQSFDSLYSSMINNRPDIKLQNLKIDESREELNSVKSGFKPQLWMVGQYQVQAQSDHVEVWNYAFPRTSFAGLKLTIPIYSGNRLKYKTRQSQLSIQQNELQLTDLKNRLTTELFSITANLEEAYRQLGIQDQNVQAAEINYNMLNERYKHGLGTRLEFTDAELSLTKAKMNQIQSVFAIKVIELQLEKSLGLLKLNK